MNRIGFLSPPSGWKEGGGHVLQSGGPLRHMRHVLQIRIAHVCDMMRSGGALTDLSVIPDVGLGGVR